MSVQLKNNAFTTVPTGVSSTDTTVTVATGDGSKFPALGSEEYFYLTLVDVSGNYEIVQVTARVDDVLTIVRGQGDTLPIPFPPNSRAELRVTVENVLVAAGDYLLL